MTEDVRDRHGIEILAADDCFELLATQELGRVGFVDAGTPRIFPVNHLVDGRSVVFRSPVGSKLDNAERHHPFAFEVDAFDAGRDGGWSVLATGLAEVVDDDEEIAGLEARGLNSWAIGDAAEMTWIRIRPDEISGRRVAGSSA